MKIDNLTIISSMKKDRAPKEQRTKTELFGNVEIRCFLKILKKKICLALVHATADDSFGHTYSFQAHMATASPGKVGTLHPLKFHTVLHRLRNGHQGQLRIALPEAGAALHARNSPQN